MDEYVNRETTIRALLNDSPEQVGYSREDAADCIRYMDAADVAPVRHGQWAYYDTYIDGITIFRCTCCGDLQSGRDGWGWKKNYCPKCGAKMDGGNDD